MHVLALQKREIITVNKLFFPFIFPPKMLLVKAGEVGDPQRVAVLCVQDLQ